MSGAKEIEEHVQRTLLADPTIRDYVGDRIYIHNPDSVEVGRPRVVPGDRWDQHEIDDVIREQTCQASESVPWHYRSARADGVPEVVAWVDELVATAIEENHRGYPTVRHGRSLVLFGRTGTGKTYAAFGAVRELARSGVRCRWLVVSASKLFDQLRPRHGIDSEQEFERYSGAGLLVVDDLGAHKLSEWCEEKLTRLIDERYQEGRPSIYITNLTPKGFQKVVDGRPVYVPGFDELVGERVASRLAECATEVVVGGPDRRRGGAR